MNADCEPWKRKAHGFSRCAWQRRAALISFVPAVVVLVISGCAVGPDYVRPQPPVPQAWSTALDRSLTAEPVDAQGLAAWWTALDDPVMTGLIRRAVEGSLDRKKALARLQQARAQRTVASAGLFPSLDAGGSVTKSHTGGQDAGSPRVSTSYRADLDAAWEIDIFGGQRRSVEAAEADIEAAREGVNDVLVSLSAEVALNYIEVRTTQARIAAAQANLSLQEQTCALEKARHAAGLSDALSEQQAISSLESTRAQIPSLNASLEEYMNRLAVLLGETPGALAKELAEAGPIPSVPARVVAGVPADAVRNRPDVRKAEQELVAQTARVGVSTAELYPRLTLTGTLGTAAVSTGDLFRAGAGFWSYGPGVSWPIFRAGSLRAAVKVQSALQEQALLSYEAAVLTALEEAENAVSAYVKEQARRDTLKLAVQGAREAEGLAEKKYEAGLADFDTVLTAQRTLTSLQDSLAQSTGSVAGNLVRLYKALGGGWASPSTDKNTRVSS